MPVHETKECQPLGSEQHQAPETGDAIVDASEAPHLLSLLDVVPCAFYRHRNTFPGKKKGDRSIV